MQELKERNGSKKKNNSVPKSHIFDFSEKNKPFTTREKPHNSLLRNKKTV